jgi:DNA-directed RNA polymerase sigma subunit (sigma70/sigma32)
MPATGARDDDTELDALAAHVRSRGELSAAAAGRLIGAAHDGDARARELLVDSSLRAVLDEAFAHRDRGVEVVELFQEGSMAAVVAVDEYVDRGGAASGLGADVRRAVASHLDQVVEREERAAAAAAAAVHDSQLLEAAQITLRRRFGRDPTEVELAAILQWAPERVEVVARMLGTARELSDSDIAMYLDDLDADDGGTG